MSSHDAAAAEAQSQSQSQVLRLDDSEPASESQQQTQVIAPADDNSGAASPVSEKPPDGSPAVAVEHADSDDEDRPVGVGLPKFGQPKFVVKISAAAPGGKRRKLEHKADSPLPERIVQYPPMDDGSQVPGTPPRSPASPKPAESPLDEQILRSPLLCNAPSCSHSFADATSLGKHWRAHHADVAADSKAHSEFFEKIGLVPCPHCRMPFAGIALHMYSCEARLRKQTREGKEREAAEAEEEAHRAIVPFDLAGTHLARYIADAPRLLRSIPERNKTLFVTAASTAFAALSRARTAEEIHKAVVNVLLLPRSLLKTGRGNRRARRVDKALRRALDLIKSGDSLQELFMPGNEDEHASPAAASIAAKARRFREALRSGAGLGFASGKLRSSGIADVSDPEVFRGVLALHPMPIAPPFGMKRVSLPASAPHTRIVADDAFRKRILSLSRGRAPGLDGWTNEMLSTVAADPEALRGIAAFVELYTNGEIPPKTLPALNAGRLTPVLKSQDSKAVRPITVDSSLVRLAKQISVNDARAEMNAALAPTDQSFGERGGAERIVHLLRNALNAGRMVIAFDIINAFNTRSRVKILESLFQAKSLDRLWRIAWNAYSTPSVAFARGSDGKLKEFTNFSGVKQGDPLGILFALSLVSSFKKIRLACPDIELISFQDNLYIFGAPEACVAAVDVVKNELAADGSVLNLLKTEAVYYAKKDLPAAVPTALAARNIKLTRDCWATLGSALPNAALPNESQALVDKLAGEHLTTLLQLSNKAFTFQEAVLLLRLLASPSQIHAARCTPPRFFHLAAAMVNETVVNVIKARMQVDKLPGKVIVQLRLPLRFGGLGLQSLADISAPAFIASLANAAPLFASHALPILDDATLSAVSDLLDQSAPASSELVPVPAAGETASLYLRRFVTWFSERDLRQNLVHSPIGLQRLLTHGFQERRFQEFQDNARTPFAKSRLKSLTRKGASTWLKVLPTDPFTVLPCPEFDIALRHHCDLPLAKSLPVTCRCGKLGLHSKVHFMTCKSQTGNGHIKRHDTVVRAIQSAINNSGATASIEIRGLNHDKNDRPDLECVLGATSILADVMVLHPATPSRLAKPDTDPLAEAAKVKTAKYASLVGDGKLHEEFVPLIFEAYGACGPPARDFFKRIAAAAQLAGYSRQGTLATLAARVAIAIQRGNARTVLLAIANAP